MTAELVERRLRQEFSGVELHEVLGVAEGDWDEGLQDGIDDV